MRKGRVNATNVLVTSILSMPQVVAVVSYDHIIGIEEKWAQIGSAT